jgi:ATP-dependent Clp protease protease subunit
MLKKVANTGEEMMSMSANVFVDADRRTIFFHDAVNPNTMALVCSAMQSFIMIDDEMEETQKEYERPPIHLYINSPGGSLYDMWALVDIMLMTDTPIYPYCTGYAMSAAFVIFICGDRRFITPHVTLMCHQLSSAQDGTYLDLAQGLDELTWAQSNAEQLVCDFTKIPPEKMKRIRTEKLDYYIHAKEALELQVADCLIGEDKVQFTSKKVDEDAPNPDTEETKAPSRKKKFFKKPKKTN